MHKITDKRALVVWGRHPAHGPSWIKLHRYSARANKARADQGWNLAFMAKGETPNGNPYYA